MQKKRKKRCIFCSGLNTKRYGQRSKKRDTAFGKRNYSYQRWFCNNCRRVFRPLKNEAINFAIKIKICDLYYDSEPEKCVKNTFLGDNIVGKGYLKLKKS